MLARYTHYTTHTHSSTMHVVKQLKKKIQNAIFEQKEKIILHSDMNGHRRYILGWHQFSSFLPFSCFESIFVVVVVVSMLRQPLRHIPLRSTIHKIAQCTSSNGRMLYAFSLIFQAKISLIYTVTSFNVYRALVHFTVSVRS